MELQPNTFFGLNSEHQKLAKTCQVVEKCLRLTDASLNQYFYQMERTLVSQVGKGDFPAEVEKYLHEYLIQSNPWSNLIFPRVKVKLEKHFGTKVNMFISPEEIVTSQSDNTCAPLNQFFHETIRTIAFTKEAAHLSVKVWDQSLSSLPLPQEIRQFAGHMRLARLIPYLLELDPEHIGVDRVKILRLMLQGLLTNHKLRMRDLITFRIAEHAYQLHDQIFGSPWEQQQSKNTRSERMYA
ncbi:hypothetical protein [Candidatus Formimonas warabiya]|uniref:Uncharacterized protein n=1 Tax=Formimonas warabiya TaxID=1761012 RepID=A0A3G1KUZ2_FORW1|nr:hypothetical protein [Candidatus Formimonas warabiya]ATW26254.1 hypothetical protein DCMF_17150 [Candidatus Formimonas warabiya]